MVHTVGTAQSDTPHLRLLTGWEAVGLPTLHSPPLILAVGLTCIYTGQCRSWAVKQFQRTCGTELEAMGLAVLGARGGGGGGGGGGLGEEFHGVGCVTVEERVLTVLRLLPAAATCTQHRVRVAAGNG